MAANTGASQRSGKGWQTLTILAYFPINEWLIHTVMLHYRPRKLFGLTIDFYLPKTHRRHHADPWNLKWVFIPRHVHLLVAPTAVVLLALLWPWKELVLTGLATYLILGLHYEWGEAETGGCPVDIRPAERPAMDGRAGDQSSNCSPAMDGFPALFDASFYVSGETGAC